MHQLLGLQRDERGRGWCTRSRPGRQVPSNVAVLQATRPPNRPNHAPTCSSSPVRVSWNRDCCAARAWFSVLFSADSQSQASACRCCCSRVSGCCCGAAAGGRCNRRRPGTCCAKLVSLATRLMVGAARLGSPARLSSCHSSAANPAPAFWRAVCAVVSNSCPFLVKSSIVLDTLVKGTNAPCELRLRSFWAAGVSLHAGCTGSSPAIVASVSTPRSGKVKEWARPASC